METIICRFQILQPCSVYFCRGRRLCVSLSKQTTITVCRRSLRYLSSSCFLSEGQLSTGKTHSPFTLLTPKYKFKLNCVASAGASDGDYDNNAFLDSIVEVFTFGKHSSLLWLSNFLTNSIHFHAQNLNTAHLAMNVRFQPTIRFCQIE